MNFSKIESSVLGIGSRTILSAGIGSAATLYFLENSGGSIPVMGYEVPTVLLFATVFGVASGVNETVKDVIEPYTPQYLKSSYALQPLSTGIAAMGVNYLVSAALGGGFMPTVPKLLYPLLIGTGADLLAGYVTDNVVKPITTVKNTVDTIQAYNPVEILEGNFNLGDIGSMIGMF